MRNKMGAGIHNAFLQAELLAEMMVAPGGMKRIREAMVKICAAVEEAGIEMKHFDIEDIARQYAYDVDLTIEAVLKGR